MARNAHHVKVNSKFPNKIFNIELMFDAAFVFDVPFYYPD